MAADGEDDVDYLRLPSFVKVFSEARNMDELRLPPEFIGRYGEELPFDCRLVMPNGVTWTVRLLKIASGAHFQVGWAEFRRDNRLHHGDFLIFTLVDVGTFRVKRYNMSSGCAPRSDLEMVHEYDIEEIYSPNLDSSDDYEPSDIGEDTDDDDDYVAERGALDMDGYPTFMVTLTKTHMNRTLEIPNGFWKKHIRMSALQATIYFLVDGKTWMLTLGHNPTKIWIKHGWRRFRENNALVEGVRCNFKPVDADDVQFYVWFDHV
ncbi:B3 domain-containing protein REM1-like [Salvia divinorum]|uniref:B3 domain-containing protein REM1-like n=1 Tax=Salvia divinorum TaxID=28513 RepID=A0ABD1IJP8_SALDI